MGASRRNEHIHAARGHAFNIGGGMENSMSLLELLRYLEDRLGLKLTTPTCRGVQVTRSSS
jgi:hypothetical protein